MSADLSDLSYSVKYGSVIITDCKTTAAGELEIPALIGEKPVTKIGSAAFRGCSNLTSIIIPDGVTTIGDESFYSILRVTHEGATNTQTGKLTSIIQLR